MNVMINDISVNLHTDVQGDLYRVPAFDRMIAAAGGLEAMDRVAVRGFGQDEQKLGRSPNSRWRSPHPVRSP
jgi:hypothetical protein